MADTFKRTFTVRVAAFVAIAGCLVLLIRGLKIPKAEDAVASFAPQQANLCGDMFVDRLNAMLASGPDGTPECPALASPNARRLLREWGRAESGAAVQAITNLAGFGSDSAVVWQGAAVQIAIGISERHGWEAALHALADFRAAGTDWVDALLSKFVETVLDDDPVHAAQLVQSATLNENPDPLFWRALWAFRQGRWGVGYPWDPNYNSTPWFLHVGGIAGRMVESAHARGSAVEGIREVMEWAARYPEKSCFPDAISSGGMHAWVKVDIQGALDFQRTENPIRLIIISGSFDAYIVEGLALARRYTESVERGLGLGDDAIASAVKIGLEQDGDGAVPQLLAGATQEVEQKRVRAQIAAVTAEAELQSALAAPNLRDGPKRTEWIIRRLLEANSHSTDADTFRTVIAGRLTTHDLDLARSWLEKVPEKSSRALNDLAVAVTDGLYPFAGPDVHDPLNRALEFIDTLPSGATRSLLGYHLAVKVGEAGERGGNLLCHGRDFPRRALARFHRADPLLAWIFVASIPAYPFTTDGILDPLREWRDQVTEHFGASLDHLPTDSLQRNLALETFCRRAYKTQPERAAEYLKLISDPAARERVNTFLKAHGVPLAEF